MKRIAIPGICMLFLTCASLANPIFPVTTQMDLISAKGGSCIPNPVVSSDTVSNFCTLFSETVASCWPPVGAYKNFTPSQMKANYALLVGAYGSLSAACQKFAPSNGSTPQACVDQWTCYIHGGVDSRGGSCSGTKAACV